LILSSSLCFGPTIDSEYYSFENYNKCSLSKLTPIYSASATHVQRSTKVRMHSITKSNISLLCRGSFDSQVLYNPKYIDAHLSEQGIKQCHEVRKSEDFKQIKVILVSPLNRALQTASLVFRDMKVPIIVRPELT